MKFANWVSLEYELFKQTDGGKRVSPHRTDEQEKEGGHHSRQLKETNLNRVSPGGSPTQTAARTSKLTEIQAKLAYAHLLSTHREPTAYSLETLEALYRDLVEEYQNNDFKTLANTAEEAAWVNLAGVLLNIDLALTK